MKPAFRSFWLGTGLTILVGIGAAAFAQPLLDDGALVSESAPTGGVFLTPGQRDKARFQKSRGRMELQHRGLELVDSVYQVSTDPARAAILQMHRIERIYREQRDRDGLMTFYRDVLNRTDNLAIRNVAYLKLSALTAHSTDFQGALALLEQGLEENLRRAR